MNLGNFIGIIVIVAALILGFICTFEICRLVITLFASTKKETAVAVNKQACERQILSKNEMTRVKTVFLAEFLCGDKKLTFEVSKETYDSLVLNETGILTYKKKRFLDFRTIPDGGQPNRSESL